MKINLINLEPVANRWNLAILPAALCLVWVAFLSGAAQVKNDKRITAVQLGSGAEGARVTIVSDAGLNDYEAFRRGERFYVRIPLAEFMAAKPGFHGDGFDDVQVQKVGDSVVVSFKLQPGASARVDQHGNRLEVIFTSLARTQRNGANVADNRASAANATGATQTNPDRQRDAAGPSPSDVSQSSRNRFVSERASARGSSQQQSAPAAPAATPNANARGTKDTGNPTTAKATPVTSVSPTPEPNYPAWTNSPAPAGTPATATSRSNGSSSTADTKRQTASSWWAANRKAVLIGALILGALAVLAVFLYRRPRNKSHTRIATPVLSQPKYSTESERDILSAEPSVGVESPSSEAPFATEAEEIPDWRRAPIEPAFASAHSASTKGSVATVPNPAFVANGEASSEEREVFEL